MAVPFLVVVQPSIRTLRGIIAPFLLSDVIGVGTGIVSLGDGEVDRTKVLLTKMPFFWGELLTWVLQHEGLEVIDEVEDTAILQAVELWKPALVILAPMGFDKVQGIYSDLLRGFPDLRVVALPESEGDAVLYHRAAITHMKIAVRPVDNFLRAIRS